MNSFRVLPVLVAVPGVALVLFLARSAQNTAEAPPGRNFYVAPNGAPSGDGSVAAPWDLPTAFARPAAVRPGDNVLLRAGTYQPGNKRFFTSSLRGDRDQYITVRPYANERVIIDGGITVEGPWTLFRDLEVTSTDTDRSSEQATSFPTDVVQAVGFNVFAANVKIVNNVIHDNSAGINSWAESPDGEVYGNLIYYNGWSAAKRAHGHGMYMQNFNGTKRIEDNIVFSQFGQGIQIYGSPAAHLDNFHLEGNIIFNNGVLNHEHSRNVLIGGGSIARNPVITGNFMYFPPATTLGGDHNIGYDPYGAGCTNLTFTNNYVASDGAALTLFKCTVSSLKGNTLYGELKGFTAAQYPRNEYFTRTSPPRGSKIFVRPNRYEPKRANVVIFNWDHRENLPVDGSLVGLDKGDAYEVHNAEDYFGDVTSGIFDGKAIVIRLTGRTVSKPLLSSTLGS